jgi:hypothetical protein
VQTWRLGEQRLVLYVDNTDNSHSLKLCVETTNRNPDSGLRDDFSFWTTLKIEVENTPKRRSVRRHVLQELNSNS